nr:ferric reduction oxidase 4 [Tanacetum cinerariifolium]
MECNKDEATRAKEIAESKFSSKDLNDAKKFALKAQNLFPGLEDDDTVKKDYRKLALSLHPDKNKSVDSWKIAFAFMASYIGGAINYVAVSLALAVYPSVIAAGPANSFNSGSGYNAPVLQTATALAVSFAICKGATHVPSSSSE